MVTSLEASAILVAMIQTGILVEIARRLGHISGQQEQIKHRIGAVEDRQETHIYNDE